MTPVAERNTPHRPRRAPRVGGMAAFPGLAALVIVFPGPALAQAPVVSQPVVQQIPGKDGFTLNEALTRLGRNPRDVVALVDAGTAALEMGDVDAATGFFKRASQIEPGNIRAKAGLAGALVRSGNPIDAIPLFIEAEKAGPLDAALAADRGLAFDLVGDNAAAQAHYRQALARGPDDEVTRRLALSLAIAGDRRGTEATLLPQLRQQDKSGWRTRAFALAILGDTEQAVGIAKTILPAELATAITPYLRYMPRLTPAQQAAAANFGTFPLPSEIGRDDPRIARYAPASGNRARVASADAALIPRGESLGGRDRSRRGKATKREQEQARAVRIAPPEIQPVPAPAPVATAIAVPARPAVPLPTNIEPAPVRVAAAPPVPVATHAPVPSTPTASVRVATASPVAMPAPPPPAAVRTAPVPVAAAPAGSMSGDVVPSRVPAPGFDLASIAEQGVKTPPPSPSPLAPRPAPMPPAASPAPTPPPVATPAPARPSLADAFADLGRPAIDATPASGAVDIRRITPARERARTASATEKPKPAPPSHPSRIWVQVATGRDKGALAFDWRRMGQQAKDAFKGRQGFTSAWGQTNRLLTGPFASEAAANTFMAQLRRGGIDGSFLWTSPAGQVVDALAGR